jgi:carboxypeptidase Taq
MSLSSAEAYTKVSKSLRDINNLEGISGLLGWDEMVMLPPGSSGSRGAQKETLAGVLYDKKADSEFGALLNQLAADSTLDKVQAANVRIANADHQRLVRVPKELVQEQAKLETDAYNAWVAARTASDYSKFSGVLQAWVDSKKKEAEYIEPGGHTYDTLLYSFEKGMSSARLDEIFEEVKAGLVPLISDIKNKGSAPSRDCLDGKYSVDAQAKMCKDIALDLGFDIEKGRLDVSVHPFSKYTSLHSLVSLQFAVLCVLSCLLAFQVCWCA